MCAASCNEYEYINENGIDEELKCVICRQPFESPVSLSACNHTFCKGCIQAWLNDQQTCPTCRQNISRNRWGSFRAAPYVPINTRIVLNQLDRLLIRCLLCNETNIQRCLWKDHEKTCLKRTVICPSADIKCTWKGSREALSTHLNKCTFQEVRPIIDELKTDLTTTRTAQVHLKNSVKILERKVAFLLKFIQHGNLMTQNCSKSTNECEYHTGNGFNRGQPVVCYICHQHTRPEQISLHACSGTCICQFCINFQYLEQFRTRETPNEEGFLEDPEEFD